MNLTEYQDFSGERIPQVTMKQNFVPSKFLHPKVYDCTNMYK